MAERKRVTLTLSERASSEKASIVITSQHATSCLSFICFYQCEYRVISTEMRGVTFSRYFSNQSLASVARRRRRGVCLWRVSLSCGRHGRTKKPKTAQVMSKANVYLYSYNNSPNTGLYAPLGFARALFLSSSLVCRCATLGCIMLRPVKKKKNSSDSYGKRYMHWLNFTLTFTWCAHLACLPTGHRKCCFSTRLSNVFYPDPTPLLTHILIALVLSLGLL